MLASPPSRNGRLALTLVAIGAIAVPLAWGGCTLDRSGSPATSNSGGNGSTSNSSSSGLGGSAGGATAAGGAAGVGGAGGIGAGGAGGMAGAGGMPLVAATVACGYYHTCATRSDNTGECWGRNDKGQLGDGNTTDSNVPVPLVLGEQVLDIQGGHQHTCALLVDGTVRCVGWNDKGQLGDGSNTDSTSWVTVANITASALALGDKHTCAILTDDTVSCWGHNNRLQLGNIATDNSFSTPVPVMGLPMGVPVIQISAGKEHSCAVLSDGYAFCWGSNDHAELAFDSAGNYAPTYVLSGVRQISASERTTCAVTKANAAYCWGENDKGEGGIGVNLNPIKIPTLVAGMHSIRSISAKWEHACAVLTNDTVWCWGKNGSGAVGTDSSGANVLSPVQVPRLFDTDTVTTGLDHSCALLKNGSIRCWGSHSNGQLGSGGNGGGPTPVTPIGY